MTKAILRLCIIEFGEKDHTNNEMFGTLNSQFVFFGTLKLGLFRHDVFRGLHLNINEEERLVATCSLIVYCVFQ